MRSAHSLQLPRRQARSLEQWPRLEHERLLEPPSLVQRLDDGERSPALDRRKSARVADRHRANRAVADELLYELGTPPTHLPGRFDLFVADRNRLGEHCVEAILRPLRDSVDHAGEVDRSRARDAQRAHGLTECFCLPVNAICERNAERTSDSERGSAAHGKSLDRFDERGHVGDAERHDFRGKPGLVDQLDRVTHPVNGPHVRRE